MEEEEEEEGSLAKEDEGLVEPVRETQDMLDEADGEDECREEERESGVPVTTTEEREEEQKEMELEKEDDGVCVISDQPVSRGEKPISQTSEVPPPSLPALTVQCCQGQPDTTSPEEGQEEEAEPNNNTNKPPPLPPESSVPPIHAARLTLNQKEAQHTGKEGEGEEKTTEECEREKDDLTTDRSQPQNALGARDEAASKVEQGKRHSIKLRERLFQFPLCEKALALNIPAAHNKPKILPLAQYNCCHVL